MSQPWLWRKFALQVGLDSLGDRPDSQTLCKRKYRLGDCLGPSVTEFSDETTVHLEGVERQRVEIGQRGVAGSEVVECDQNPARRVTGA